MTAHLRIICTLGALMILFVATAISDDKQESKKENKPKMLLQYVQIDIQPKAKREIAKDVTTPLSARHTSDSITGGSSSPQAFKTSRGRTKVARRSRIRKKVPRRVAKYRHSTRVLRTKPATVLLPPFHRPPRKHWSTLSTSSTTTATSIQETSTLEQTAGGPPTLGPPTLPTLNVKDNGQWPSTPNTLNWIDSGSDPNQNQVQFDWSSSQEGETSKQPVLLNNRKQDDRELQINSWVDQGPTASAWSPVPSDNQEIWSLRIQPQIKSKTSWPEESETASPKDWSVGSSEENGKESHVIKTTKKSSSWTSPQTQVSSTPSWMQLADQHGSSWTIGNNNIIQSWTGRSGDNNNVMLSWTPNPLFVSQIPSNWSTSEDTTEQSSKWIREQDNSNNDWRPTPNGVDSWNPRSSKYVSETPPSSWDIQNQQVKPEKEEQVLNQQQNNNQEWIVNSDSTTEQTSRWINSDNTQWPQDGVQSGQWSEMNGNQKSWIGLNQKQDTSNADSWNKGQQQSWNPDQERTWNPDQQRTWNPDQQQSTGIVESWRQGQSQNAGNLESWNQGQPQNWVLQEGTQPGIIKDRDVLNSPQTPIVMQLADSWSSVPYQEDQWDYGPSSTIEPTPNSRSQVSYGDSPDPVGSKPRSFTISTPISEPVESGFPSALLEPPFNNHILLVKNMTGSDRPVPYLLPPPWKIDDGRSENSLIMPLGNLFDNDPLPLALPPSEQTAPATGPAEGVTNYDNSLNEEEEKEVSAMLLASEVASMGMKLAGSHRGMEMARLVMTESVMPEMVRHQNRTGGSLSSLDVAETQGYYNKFTKKSKAKKIKKSDKEVIPGEAGKDYPIYATPPTSTQGPCKDAFGYLPDPTTRCQVFYVCTGLGMGEPMLCPNGTLFSKDFLVCDWWYNVECESAPQTETPVHQHHQFTNPQFLR